MKKLVYSLMCLVCCSIATATLTSCNEEKKAPFNYRGLVFTMPTSQFVDSMLARGFAVDSIASDSGRTVVLANPAEHYRVLVAFSDEKLQAVQETYLLSSNDSTRAMWQQLHDGLEKELGAWPDCPILKDDHKIANFDAATGIISVILENTYTPTLTVRYTPKQEDKK